MDPKWLKLNKPTQDQMAQGPNSWARTFMKCAPNGSFLPSCLPSFVFYLLASIFRLPSSIFRLSFGAHLGGLLGLATWTCKMISKIVSKIIENYLRRPKPKTGNFFEKRRPQIGLFSLQYFFGLPYLELISGYALQLPLRPSQIT